MSEEIPFIPYEELLKELEKTEGEKNLLLGNGFNNSLGVTTDYKSIMEKMREECSVYTTLPDTEHDIETIIGRLKGDTEDEFLQNFISYKIKLDFMKAAHEIVQSNIKNIYNHKNNKIYLLFRKFTNYFTLNYDPLLYLLLIKYKKPEQTKDYEQPMLLFDNTIKYKENNLTEKEKEIYEDLKRDYKEGKLRFQDDTQVTMKTLTKSDFSNVVTVHLKGKNKKVTGKKLKTLIDLLWKEKEDKIGDLCIDDGFASGLFETKEEKIIKYIQSETQNVFFLHGTFFFCKKGKEIFKITSTQNKALYQRLEDIISNDNEDIICVFKDTGKLTDIQSNTYLNDCYEKLQKLTGSLVIIGCSLSKNDEHIFTQINESAVDTVYLSSMAKKKNTLKKQEKIIKDDYEKAKKYFSEKNVVLFDATSISYEG